MKANGSPMRGTQILHVFHPPGYLPERQYVFDVLLREFLGLDYVAHVHPRREVWIAADDGGDPRRIVLPDVLFGTAESDWLRAGSLPRRPLQRWAVPKALSHAGIGSRELPVFYGADRGAVPFAATQDRVFLGVDVFGTALFMLTRYEEMVSPDRCPHGRFPASAALSCREGLSDRPIVNEYLELLWAAMRLLWPGLQRKKRSYRLLLSHDVDWPFCTAKQGAFRILKAMAGDVLKRREASLALGRLRSYLQTRRGATDRDFGNTFSWIMDRAEEHGLTGAFNFIPAHTAGAMDGNYSLHDPWIRGLLRAIRRRKHEIGFHPSYHSFADSAQTRREWSRLRAVCREEGIEQDRWGGRQHFLRWENPVTWQSWADAGLDYDSTLGFADRPGFRCGTCYEYPVYNLVARTALPLRERPLIVMDQALRAPFCRSWEAAHRRVVDLSETCRRLEGDFTLLWHNSMLVSGQQRRWYARILEKAA